MERKKNKKGDNRKKNLKVVVRMQPKEENNMKKQTDEFTKDQLDEACDMLDGSEFMLLEDLAIAQERLEKWRSRFTTSLRRLRQCRDEVTLAADRLGQFYTFLNSGKDRTSTELHREDKDGLLN